MPRGFDWKEAVKEIELCAINDGTYYPSDPDSAVDAAITAYLRRVSSDLMPERLDIITKVKAHWEAK